MPWEAMPRWLELVGITFVCLIFVIVVMLVGAGLSMAANRAETARARNDLRWWGK